MDSDERQESSFVDDIYVDLEDYVLISGLNCIADSCVKVSFVATSAYLLHNIFI